MAKGSWTKAQEARISVQQALDASGSARGQIGPDGREWNRQARIGTMPNRLLVTEPTLVCRAVNNAGAAQYTPVVVGTSEITVDAEEVDIGSSLPTAKLVVGASDTGSNEFRYDSLAAAIQLGPDDVWIVTIKCPDDYSSAYVQLRTSHLSAPSGVNYRDATFAPGSLKPGWNVLIVKNDEILIGGADYGMVGTTTASTVVRAESGDTKWHSPILSVRVRVYLAAGQTFHFGGVYTAPAGWCKAAVIWGADDVPASFIQHAIPLIEAAGWRCTLNAVARYAADRSYSSYASLADLRAMAGRGHEVCGHTLSHADMTAGTLTDKRRELREAAKFWSAAGIPSAARAMAWPFLNYDQTAVSEAAAAGYRFCRGGAGVFGQSWRPAIGALSYPSTSMEYTNRWYSDAHIEGGILRGQAVVAYMHDTVPGGVGIHTRPGATQHYLDHLREWIALVKRHEAAGRVVCCTQSEYFRLCGVDPLVDDFA